MLYVCVLDSQNLSKHFSWSCISLSLQVADTLLLAYDAEGVEGDREKLALQCCFSQGLPATCHVIQVTQPNPSSLHSI